ncbi:MAG: 50S ribosomal protein L29 [Candidatus Zeuxoniibacter abyssi]|nr:MAG: 50S ribosomal protein L29 [Candidatus Persebacteraceae bacterium AB1(2)]
MRKKTTEDLRAELLALHREAFNLRMQKTVQQTEKSSELRRVRRDIARALTITREKSSA